MKSVVIAGYARSPFHFAKKGDLTRVRPDDLAAQVVAALVERTKVDPSTIPFSDKVPTATETLDVAFAFWGKLLEAQHTFLTGMVDVYAPASTTAAKVTTVTAASKMIEARIGLFR